MTFLRSPAVGRVVFLAVTLLMVRFAYWNEVRWIGFWIVLAGFLFFYTLFRLAMAGPIFSSLSAATLIEIILHASKYKFTLTARRLHPYDVYTYGNLNSLIYFKRLYPSYYLYLYGAIATIIVGGLIVLYLERFRKPSRTNMAVFCLLFGGAVVFNRVSSFSDSGGLGEGNRFMHFDYMHTSTFILSSILSVPQLLAGNVFEYGPKLMLNPDTVASVSKNGCSIDPAETPPNVVTILRESITIPSLVDGMGVSAPDETLFRSFDGNVYRLRVETYGAGSAHTILSLLTGLSSEAFGGLKNLDADLIQGRVAYPLPLLFKDCGYRTIAVTTGAEGYVAAREFYKSLGFDEYTDMADLENLMVSDVSDRAVYAIVAAKIVNGDKNKPTFLYVDTTASHAPYDEEKLRPEERISETDSISNPVVKEYVRRLMIGERDLDHFAASLRSSPVGQTRPLVVLDFGDHQPYFTKDLPGHPGYVNEDRYSDDPHLLTYFRIREWGDYPLAGLPNDPVIDAAFMGDWLLHALRFRYEGLYSYRWGLVEKCHSRYWQCEHGNVAHELHQTMQAGGLLQIR